jgi:hypothetical protein
MKENAQKTKWLPDVLTALGGPGNKHESLLDLLTYIGQNDHYTRLHFMCNMNKSQMRHLCSCLQAELGSSVFSTEYNKIQQVLGLEHVQPRTHSYKYGKEKINWLYKPIKQVLKLRLKSHTKGPNGFQCNHLDIVVTIDHGKGHSQITCNFITPRQAKTGE